MKKWMAKSSVLSVIVPAIALVVSTPAPLDGAVLEQVNPAVQAPPLVNDSDHSNEYPWFSNDGHLFVWTRQCKTTSPEPCLNHNPPIGTDTQWLWVSYLKNFDIVWNAPHGQDLPPLQFAWPVELEPVNHAVLQAFPAGTTIKALAICDKTSDQPVLGPDGLLRYRFSLFMAIGPAGDSNPKSLYRADRVVVTIDPNDNNGEIVPSKLRFNGSLLPVTGSDTGDNETEPALTRDGKYLFWASNGWAGGVAEYMGGDGFARCSQLDQSRTSYANLPGQRFAWKDQYLGSPATSTSRTNYHTVIERFHFDDAGDTALIFERCHGQVSCAQGGVRDCECLGPDENEDGVPDDKVRLWTTGFEAAPGPYLIDRCEGCTGNEGIWKEQGRTTHPAVAGPENTDSGRDGWLLFFMRGKKIWYTKIAEVP